MEYMTDEQKIAELYIMDEELAKTAELQWKNKPEHDKVNYENSYHFYDPTTARTHFMIKFFMDSFTNKLSQAGWYTGYALGNDPELYNKIQKLKSMLPPHLGGKRRRTRRSKSRRLTKSRKSRRHRKQHLSFLFFFYFFLASFVKIMLKYSFLSLFSI